MKIAKVRRVSQAFGLILGFLGATGIGMTHLIFPGIHCYACPWAITICPIGLAQNLVIFGTVPYYWIGMIVAYGLAAGRGFCGWFCPFGTLNDLLSFRKVKTINVISYSKYVVLAGTIIAAWVFTDTMFCKLCPVASIEASIPYLIMGVSKVNQPFLVHMGTLAFTLVGMVLISRFWCRYLCPMGALFSLFNRVSFLKLKLDKMKCEKCGACAPACPMGIVPYYQHDNHNCIKCGRCVDACHLGALSMDLSLKSDK
ncbi:4Fe-4S binding protein [Candidatus Bipolaricaulota bacterium]|nr:4Fe-4S binding protein [Candidatus Bipolaricaulota bacterium]